MKHYSRLSHLEKRNVRRFKQYTDTGKKRIALRGGNEPPNKRRRNIKARPQNEQLAVPSTSSDHFPIATTFKGSHQFPSAGPSTSIILGKRFNQFVHCLTILLWNACLHSISFLDHVNAFAYPAWELMSTYNYLCKATVVMATNGIDAGAPYREDLVRKQLSIDDTQDESGPSVKIQNWGIFDFKYSEEVFRRILMDERLSLGLKKGFNGKEIMIWMRLPTKGRRNGTIGLDEFPKKLIVTRVKTAHAQKDVVELQFQGLIFGRCVNPRSPEMIENFTIVYVRPPGGLYGMYDSKQNVPKMILTENCRIPCDEGVLVLYTI